MFTLAITVDHFQFTLIHGPKIPGSYAILFTALEFISMNQGKLEVVKQEMARLYINILGISKLRWTRMGKFNSDDNIFTTVGTDPLKEME